MAPAGEHIAHTDTPQAAERRMGHRMFVGGGLGAVIGYAVAIATGASALDLAFWCGLGGFFAGFLAPVRLLDRRLALDQAMLLLYRKDYWVAVKRGLPLLPTVLGDNPGFGVVLAIFGGCATLGGVLNWIDSDPRGSGAALTIGIGSFAVDVWLYRHRIRERITRGRAAIGITAIILGVGTIAALLPETLRFVFQDGGYLPPGEQLVIGIAAMMITGGWFLRRSKSE